MFFMSWDAEDVALLKKLWAIGESAAQIACLLGYSRNAVCAKLLRMGLKPRAQATNRKAQDRIGAEAKASVVDGLRPSGG
jgi:hypothetical protein